LPSHNEEGNVSVCVGVSGRAADGGGALRGGGGERRESRPYRRIADRLAARIARAGVHHEKNLGYGGAVNSGLRSGTQPFLLLADGDGQFDRRRCRS